MNEIGFDSRMIESTGIGTYIRGLLKGFQSIPQSLKKLALFGEAAEPYFRAAAFPSKIYSLQEQASYPGLLRQCRLWHAPHYNIPYWKGKTKLVVTVHDLIHWIYRDRFFTPAQKLYAKTWFTRVVKISDHIITVSERTKKDLLESFGGDPAKISVIYESVDIHFKPAVPSSEHAVVLERHAIRNPYFLYVGSLKPHKNVETLLKVFLSQRKTGKLKNDLVLVGKPDPGCLEAFQPLHQKEGVIPVDSISHGDLKILYSQAQALIHPSFYEGFGLTLLEAMASGIPVLSSNAASLPEVGGEAAAYFNPSDEKSLAELMVRVENDAAWRTALIEKGRANLKRFDWNETAKQTWKIYEKVLAS